jgi:hypothetical protein
MYAWIFAALARFTNSFICKTGEHYRLLPTPHIKGILFGRVSLGFKLHSGDHYRLLPTPHIKGILFGRVGLGFKLHSPFDHKPF